MIDNTKPFSTALDIHNQNVLIKLLSATIDENESLAINVEDSNVDPTFVNSIQKQIELQKRQLEILNESNEKLVKEIHNTKKVFRTKMKKIQEKYEKIIQEKEALESHKDLTVKSLNEYVTEAEEEEKKLDYEILNLQSKILDMRESGMKNIFEVNWNNTTRHTISKNNALNYISQTQNKPIEMIMKIAEEFSKNQASMPSKFSDTNILESKAEPKAKTVHPIPIIKEGFSQKNESSSQYSTDDDDEEEQYD